MRINILFGLFLVTSIISTKLCAENNYNDEFMQMQKFYYEQGYKEAAKKFYQKGIEDYQKYVLENVLETYKAKFEAIEATKYLVKNGYISYPESYRIYKDGAYKIVITEPKIEKPLKPEDLFRMPLQNQINQELATQNNLNENNLNENNLDENKNLNNGLKVVDTTDTKEIIPTSVSSIKNKSSLELPKSKENINAIEKMNLKYLDGYSSYKVYFENNTEKAEFCYLLTGDSSCSSL